MKNIKIVNNSFIIIDFQEYYADYSKGILPPEILVISHNTILLLEDLLERGTTFDKEIFVIINLSFLKYFQSASNFLDLHIVHFNNAYSKEAS